MILYGKVEEKVSLSPKKKKRKKVKGKFYERSPFPQPSFPRSGENDEDGYES